MMNYETMEEYKEWLAWIGKNQQEWLDQQEKNKFGPLFAAVTSPAPLMRERDSTRKQQQGETNGNTNKL